MRVFRADEGGRRGYYILWGQELGAGVGLRIKAIAQYLGDTPFFDSSNEPPLII